MKILLTNDDGIMAEGIYIMAKELEKDHEVIIIAPESQRSAQSHAITLHMPLVIKDIELDGIKSSAYSISGTPADCVRAGLEVITGDDVDLVISGINMGLNAGMDILYSGTVSAAIEANIYEKPSIAISTEWINGKSNYHIAARYVKEILEKAGDSFLKSKIVLNINTPYVDGNEPKGLKVCKIGGVIYDYYFMEQNEMGEKLLKLKGRKEATFEEGTDRYFLYNGYATLTPLSYELTDSKLLKVVESWI